MIALPLLLLLSADIGSAADAALFNRARANMADILANQPNYICLETIDRSERIRAKGKFEPIDSLRFEVAYVDKRELYAWPGSKKFDETNLMDMVPEGSAIATGAFAGHAMYLFRFNIATVKAGEWVTEDRGRFARYPFNVPKNLSHYMMMRTRTDSEIVGYSGEIWVEPNAARVTRIELRADDIPKRLEIQSTNTVIEYSLAKVGEREFWLPSRSSEEMVTALGKTERNVTRFSGCRAFTGESTLRFDDGPIETVTPAVPAKVVDLPSGLQFEIQFDETVDSSKVHVGDPIPATLASDIKQKGEILFAKGSAVELRVVRVRHLSDWIGLDFALGEVTSPAASARLLAIPNQLPRSRVTSGVGMLQTGSDTRRPGLGTFYIRGTHLQIRKGYRSNWTIVTPQKKAP